MRESAEGRGPQPADPALREHMCSAWTVTLHFQALTTLARALRSLGRAAQAEPLERQAEAVRADFQRLLIPDGVLTGYAVFETSAISSIHGTLQPAFDTALSP